VSEIKDTFECGGWMVFRGKRYIIAEHSSYQEPMGISLNIKAVSYEHCEPMVHAFISKKPKPKKRVKKK